MLGAFRAPATGMVANQMLLDVVANNLANVNTAGFRGSQTRFQDLIYQRMPATGQFLPATLRGVEAALDPLQDLVGTGVRVVDVEKSFEPGKIVSDGDPLHAAIQGEGFFVVQLADGTAAYSRDGTFTRDALGRLVTRAGDLVLPETRIPADAREIRIDSDGLIFARLGDQSGDEAEVQLGEIQLARFTNPHGLAALGGNVFLATEASGAALVGYPGDQGYGTIVGGAVESSNVDVAEQMTTMLMGQRAYSFSARALQTIDEMVGLANNLRR